MRKEKSTDHNFGIIGQLDWKLECSPTPISQEKAGKAAKNGDSRADRLIREICAVFPARPGLP